MRVIYAPQQRGDFAAAIGFLMGPDIVRIEPDRTTEIDDEMWARLEREPSVARLLASGELRLTA